MAKSYTANPDAYQDCLKGRYWWSKRSAEGLNKGIEYFQQAVVILESCEVQLASAWNQSLAASYS